MQNYGQEGYGQDPEEILNMYDHENRSGYMDPSLPPTPNGVPHIPLAKCKVLYLGTAAPDSIVGLQAVQKPLRHLYTKGDPVLNGTEAILYAFSTGLMIRRVDDPANVIWLPIQTLHACAAVKAFISFDSRRVGHLMFVPIDSPHGEQSPSPPLFACVVHRTKYPSIKDCHGFMVKSDEAAFALVTSCIHAYEHKEGWAVELPRKRLTDKERQDPTFFKQPKENGFFYASDQNVLQKYHLSGLSSDPNEYVKEPMTENVYLSKLGDELEGIPLALRAQKISENYFKDWDKHGGKNHMFAENSPFYPGKNYEPEPGKVTVADPITEDEFIKTLDEFEEEKMYNRDKVYRERVKDRATGREKIRYFQVNMPEIQVNNVLDETEFDEVLDRSEENRRNGGRSGRNGDSYYGGSGDTYSGRREVGDKLRSRNRDEFIDEYKLSGLGDEYSVYQPKYSRNIPTANDRYSSQQRPR